MQNGNRKGDNQRPAFHFYPIARGNAPIRFHVVAHLARGGSVLLGSTSTREDAVALTRLVKSGEGTKTEVIEIADDRRR